MTPVVVRSEIPGIKQLLMGPIGTAKTSSIRSWIAAGIEVRGIFTEPSHEVVSDLKCADGFHYHYIPPAAPGWDSMLDSAKKINTLNMKALAGLDDIDKRKYDEFMDLIKSCNRYTCDRCNKDFGDVAQWSTGVVLFVDSLTGVSEMAMNLVVGSKPVKDKGDWQIAMDQVKRFVNQIATVPRCHVVLTGHVEVELDEVAQRPKIMVSTLGKKLAPTLPIYFSDVVLALRESGQFYWATELAGVELKPRNFPFSAKLPADIGPAILKWKSRGGSIEGV
ncbi:putative DNA helicase [Microcystis phage Mel-JY34]